MPTLYLNSHLFKAALAYLIKTVSNDLIIADLPRLGRCYVRLVQPIPRI